MMLDCSKFLNDVMYLYKSVIISIFSLHVDNFKTELGTCACVYFSQELVNSKLRTYIKL